MYYIIKGHNLRDDILSIIQLFYANCEIKFVEEILDNGLVVLSKLEGDMSIACIYENGKLISECSEKLENLEKKELKFKLKLSTYKAIQKILNVKMPWGTLTGVRPAKIIHEMRGQGFSDTEIRKILSERNLALDEKIDLAIQVANCEEKIISNNNNNKISIYIGIPFCPTRCIYCSFTAYSLSQYLKKVDEYLDALEKEVVSISKEISHYEIESIYIGGGTPTSLNEAQLERFLNIICKNFKLENIEFTFEAGRADTINRKKLQILKNYPVTRISINPQTMNDETLSLIGRNHTVDEFKQVFNIAREEGFDNINTDVILGLLNENTNHVYKTMTELEKLNPESVTVHTLAVKRASRLKENLEKFKLNSFYEMEKMLEITKDFAKRNELIPYYMYRQKNMVGNFENVGYCKKGLECIYNIQIMEEKQTIIALGSGASTKICIPEKNQVERVFNVKGIEEYIARIDEMIDRKINAFKLLNEK